MDTLRLRVGQIAEGGPSNRVRLGRRPALVVEGSGEERVVVDADPAARRRPVDVGGPVGAIHASEDVRLLRVELRKGLAVDPRESGLLVQPVRIHLRGEARVRVELHLDDAAALRVHPVAVDALVSVGAPGVLQRPDGLVAARGEVADDAVHAGGVRLLGDDEGVADAVLHPADDRTGRRTWCHLVEFGGHLPIHRLVALEAVLEAFHPRFGVQILNGLHVGRDARLGGAGSGEVLIDGGALRRVEAEVRPLGASPSALVSRRGGSGVATVPTRGRKIVRSSAGEVGALHTGTAGSARTLASGRVAARGGVGLADDRGLATGAARLGADGGVVDDGVHRSGSRLATNAA